MDNPARHVATIAGVKILFAMATTFEYGPHLSSRITPLITGVGPVEAAAGTGIALTHLAAKNNLPDLVFTLGSAGSRSLDHAGLYQVASVAYRDMDASPLGLRKRPHPLFGRAGHHRRRTADPGPRLLPPCRRAAPSSPGRPTTPSMPTWWTWRPMRCCAPRPVPGAHSGPARDQRRKIRACAA